MKTIGDIELPMVTDIVPEQERPTSVVKHVDTSVLPRVESHQSDPQRVSIQVTIHERLHSDNISVEEQEAEIKSLIDKDTEDCDMNFNGYKGHMVVDAVDFSRPPNTVNLKTGVVQGFFLPWPDYFENNEPE